MIKKEIKITKKQIKEIKNDVQNAKIEIYLMFAKENKYCYDARFYNKYTNTKPSDIDNEYIRLLSVLALCLSYTASITQNSEYNISIYYRSVVNDLLKRIYAESNKKDHITVYHLFD